jgi:hypothetical protein
MYLNGRVGQVLGPFGSEDLIKNQGIISVFTPEDSPPRLTKIGIQTDVGTIVCINGVEIKIGKTGIYELDEVVIITQLNFPNGASSDTIIDFIY